MVVKNSSASRAKRKSKEQSFSTSNNNNLSLSNNNNIEKVGHNDDEENEQIILNNNDEKKSQAISSSSNSGSSSDSDENDSSESESLNDNTTTNKKENNTSIIITRNKSVSNNNNGNSALFAPYRTLGVVTSSAPFHIIPNDNSLNSFICCSLGDRFCLYKTQHLQPILISQTVPAGATNSNKLKKINKNKTKIAERHIDFVITDPVLSVTIVAHGPKQSVSNNRTDTVTLYQRTRAIDSLFINNNNNCQWKIQDMVFMGRIKQEHKSGEKDGTYENTTIIAIILAKIITDSSSSNNDITKLNKLSVPIIGNDNDEDSDDSSSTNASSSNDSDNDDDSSTSSGLLEDKDDENCMGKVLILVVSRTSVRLHKSIPLTSIPTFWPNKAVHPATYLNKIVLGGSNFDNNQTALCLLNIRSGKVIHNFGCIPKTNESFVTALEQSPAVDTIAVGTNHGEVHLINLLHDKKLFTLYHKGRDGISSVEITSLSFRNDGGAMQYNIAPMAVGRSDGNITIWDLTQPEEEDMGRTVLCEIDRAHPGGVAKVQYLPQEPLLISTGINSNSILMHIFDNPDHSGRVLRQRKGHTAPPCHIRYLNTGLLANAADGTDPSLSCNILSTGGPDRTLRVFSTVRTVLDKEYSQGKGFQKRAKQIGLDSTTELLLPPVNGMATCEARSRDWCDLVTIHSNHSLAYAWSTKQGAQVGPVLKQAHWNISAMKQAPPPSTHATSVAISSCGNLALVGTKGGAIYKYNIQSGIPRGSYPRDVTDEDDPNKGKNFKQIGNVNRTMKALEKAMKVNNRKSNLDKEAQDADLEAKREKQLLAKLKIASHEGYAVTGIAVDSLNKTLISVGADSKLIFWHFSNHAPHKKSPSMLPSPATRLCLVRDSDLAAIALEDFSIVLFDCNALSIVRQFGKGIARHTGAICDVGFSPDGRNLYSASFDSTIRVWDVPTNTCVDWLGFKSRPTSLTVSPTGEFLATTHAGKLGISLWSDRSYYQTIHTDGRNISKPYQMDEPVPIGDEIEKLKTPEMKLIAGPKIDNDLDNDDMPVVPKALGLITLSGLPPSHWKNLFHLELVKERNKPEEAPQKPPSAPFFLQWRKGESIADEQNVVNESQPKDDDEEWAAAWSDDEKEDDGMSTGVSEGMDTDLKRTSEGSNESNKRRKVTHFRSHLATILEKCFKQQIQNGERRYQEVTEHVATLGPSAIDVAFSTLCSGMHDLDEGLHLLFLTTEWLKEACNSCERYEAVNAYLHRFLYIHAGVITGIEEDNNNYTNENELVGNEHLAAERDLLIRSISDLRRAQKLASNNLRDKMEHTLCLLRHFSRMV